MCVNPKHSKYLISFSDENLPESENGKESKILRRILLSGISSIILLMIIIYTLPRTVLTTSSLIEYATIVALVFFLLILLIRYFGILVFSYFYMNEYTFKPTNGFKPFVSIIIPVFNEAKIIERSVKSLLKLDYPNYEIIIVNDGSTDNTKEIAENLISFSKGVYKEVKISLINKPNGGKSSALNLGIKMSDAEFILCMDGDSLLTPSSLKMAVRHFVNPEIGAVAGNVKVLNRGKFFTDMQALEYLEGLNMARSAQSSIKLVNIIPGPIGLFRKKAIISAGFYASDTFAEDFDMTMEILEQGYKVEYEDNAISYTDAPKNLEDFMKQRRRWYRGMLQVLDKHRNLYLSIKHGIFGMFGVPNLWFDAISPFFNTALILLTLVTVFLGDLPISLFGITLYFTIQLVIGIFAVSLDPQPKLRDFLGIPLLLFYNVFLDGVRLMSFTEETINVFMKWEKPKR